MESTNLKSDDVKLLYYAAAGCDQPITSDKLAKMLGGGLNAKAARMRLVRALDRCEKEFGALPDVENDTADKSATPTKGKGKRTAPDSGKGKQGGGSAKKVKSEEKDDDVAGTTEAVKENKGEATSE
ncbi:uncharacterized protein AB675_9241 [Cyphellophora attinorum]|uniref:Uncharacterized protein n=1 Tax=Cyphellophora attinorum TaxID=1664694 RepID=A0A0N1HBH6_9EURO|nr:uncharacterized protein AB675_9241 [Phialophora attinorum]KPI41410.1 hypothetical protein AB675_9241 [Phialophora attinorum]